MRAGDSPSYLLQIDGGQTIFNWAPCDDTAKTFSMDIPHGKEMLAVDLAHFKNVNNIVVFEFCCGPYLLLKTLARVT
jgi:hypothetical protein